MQSKMPQVKVPAVVVPGESFLIRTKAWHPMETGWRKGPDGTVLPRNRIHTFVCTFNGEEVIRSDFHSGVAENPYLSFRARVPGAGDFAFEWRVDDGTVFTATARVEVARA